MAMYEKPGAASGPRDRHTHYNDPYDRPSREIRTVQKKIWGLDGLSKKERIALENSTNDGMAPKVSYSLNKSKRWELCLSPEDFIEKMASLDQGYPVAAVDQSILKREYTTNAYSQKLPNEELKSIKVKSGKGAPFLSLREAANEPLKSADSEKQQRRIKGDAAKEYVESPSILYCIVNHHTDEQFFRSCIGKSKHGAWTSRKNKIVDLKDIEDEPSDVDSDFGEDYIEPEVPESPKTTSTLADFIVSKRTSKYKKRKNGHDFEIINELPKDKSPPKSPTLTHISELVQSSITVTRFINIDTDYLQLPSFESFEFMFDFYWLNEERTKCLFIVPKGSEDVLTNFNSTLTLELSQNSKSYLIRMTVKSVHEVYIPSSSGNPEKAMSEIEVAIRKLWEQGITHLNKCKDEQPKISPSHQPQTSIFSSFNPMGDYALLGGLSKSPVSRTESESDDYEKIESESCNLCSHGRDGNLTTLKCGHTFCRFCSEKFIKEQIVFGLPQHHQQLSCVKCTTPLEPSVILISTPLLLLQAHLRFQFLKQENTLECPSKCGVAFIEESPRFGGVQCSKCKTCFCVKCKHEPHFPLTCDQMSLWETRFMPQYIAETRKPLPSSSENAESKKDEDLMLSRWKINQALSYPYLSPRNRSLPDDEIRPMNVTSSIASVCIEARYKRMKTRYLKTLIKQFGKFSTTEKAKELRYDLITALYLLEFGFAWIYFSRKYKSLEYKSIKQALYNLRGVFVEIESRLSTGNAEEAMEKINLLKNLCKIIVEKF